MGTAEGSLVVPAIAGSVLFAPVTKGAPQLGAPRTTGEGTRPAYTDELLLRALRDGVDPAGRALSATMPRYAVSEADAKALGGLSCARWARGRRPGVDEAIVHIATIVTPGVTAARRASMLDVLRTFVRAKNGGTRYETRRRTSGPWDMKQQYQGYRDWVLDEWELRGAPKEWPAQLEELYRRQPVYAIVSGIADEDWSPVDAFCARHKVPAILPQTPLPPAVPSGDGFYSLYFSKGVTLEAKAIAHHLAAAAPAGEVRQVSRCGTPGQVAAAALARELEPAAAASDCVPSGTALTAETWRDARRRREHARVVARRRRRGRARSPGGLGVDRKGDRGVPLVEPARRGGRPAAGASPGARRAGPSVRAPRRVRPARGTVADVDEGQRHQAARIVESRSTPSSPSCSPPTR